MTVDDVLSLQEIIGVAPSPKGDWLAVVIKRSGGTPSGNPDDLDTDVWLVKRQGGSAKNLTGSLGTKMRWANPIWSPDGLRLALLARTDSNYVRPYIWMVHTEQLTPLIESDVDTHAEFDHSWPDTPIVWLDSVTVLGAFQHHRVQADPFWGSIPTTQRVVQDGWARTKAGIAPAVSALESGAAIPESERPQAQLLLIDVRTGSSRVVAEGYFWRITLDPLKRRAALIVDAGRVSPTENVRLRYVHHFFASIRRTRLAIARLDSIAPVLWIDAIHDPRIPDDEMEPLAWSPDGRKLAVVAKTDSDEPYGTTAYLISAGGESVRQLTDRSLAVCGTAWAGNLTVLTLAQRTVFAPTGADTSRYDWWKIDSPVDAKGANVTNITSDLADVPRQLETTPDTNQMLALAGGRLLSLDVSRASGPRYRWLPVRSSLGDLTWSWPSRSMSGKPVDKLFAQSAKGDFYEITLDGRLEHAAPHLMPRPSTEATLSAVDPTHHLAVFTAASRTGTMLWVGDGETTQFEEKLALNQQLRDIADSKRMLISYVGADGDSLKGLILLPVGYTPGLKYPLVAFVYGGVMIRDTLSPSEIDKQFISSLNLNLMPAHGYALLIPSVPLSPEGAAADPMIDMPKGVLAAVDEAIRVGVADPARLGVFGQSFGGYSTYSIVTYTRRFHAAVALAGFDDLASLYGDFDAGLRYADFGYEMQHQKGLLEDGQLRIGASPWANLWRYLRNSPYYYADRVQTPLMIIQGDMDYVGMEQGEEFFSALYRMGKPAEFVRYWGEGHVIERSPANVRDMWHRIFGWFDQHFAVEQRSANAGHQ